MKKMNKTSMIIAISTLVVGILLGWIIFGSSNEGRSDIHDHDTSVESATTWTCSMHPQVRQAEPGDCPICGMDLIPLENDKQDEADPMAISMSPTAMQLASVSTAMVGRTNPVKQILLNGKVQADERLIYSQSSHIPGRIEKLSVNFTGEFVSKGQSIASVYSPDLVTAQEELFEASKIMDTQPQLFNAAREKLKNWKLSDLQIEEILNTGKILDEFPIQADVSGFVTKKMLNTGDYVLRGEAIYTIADLSNVWVLFDVYESDIPWIKKGNKVDFTVSSLPGEHFEGIISYLDPVIDPKTRVAKARVEYTNARGKLMPEMFASGVAKAALTGKANSLVVPKTAVMWTGKRSVVYIKTSQDQGVYFAMREITLGPDLGDSYLVESGLEEGEEIAVRGTFSIDAAAQLAGKTSMMNREGGRAVTGHDHGGTEMEEVVVQNVQEKKPMPTSQTLPVDKKAKEALQALYSAYLEWKDALVGDNFEEAQTKAVSMKEALDKIDMALFKGDAHEAWMDYQGKLNSSLEHVRHFSGIEQLRKAFQSASVTMIEMTRSFSPLGKSIYVLHCPMADNNKGADWLSSEKEIRNPYFGSSMLKCGEVREEIR